MQNKVKVLVAAALVVALLTVCPVMAGPTIKMDRPQQELYYDDEPILITGTNTGSNETYIIVRMAPGGELVNSGYAPVIDRRWEYTIPPQTISVHVTGKYNESDQNFYNLKLIRIGERPQIVIEPERIEPSTPEPTPDLKNKIDELESKLVRQNASISALETQIAQQKSTIAAIQTVAVRKTTTINFTERMEAIERNASEQRAKMAEQEDWIRQILKFLGLT